MTNKSSVAKKIVRCAVYTRKSTEEGLDQEFNTLDAQRESGEAYVKSLACEGWECLPDHYDDGGFTGGNMERPSLRRLMADIEAGRVDCVVVYKVDRHHGGDYRLESGVDPDRINRYYETNQVFWIG